MHFTSPQNAPLDTCCQAMRQLPLRVNNVARRLRKKERTVRHLASTKRIPAFKIDRKSWGFWREDVERYLALLEARDAER
jgi:excisionase family DNA binding protein